MSIKKGESLTKADPELQLGRGNNVIRWGENIRTAGSALYGLSGSFFVTVLFFVSVGNRLQSVVIFDDTITSMQLPIFHSPQIEHNLQVVERGIM